MNTELQADVDIISVLQSSLYPGAAKDSVKMVLAYCQAAKLDPFQKPVHIVPMWDSKSGGMRDVIMPGIGLYRTHAARSGALAGVSEPEFGPDKTESIGGITVTYPEWCRVSVSRELPSGKIAQFTAVERWRENYAVKGGKEKSIAPNAMWLKRPYGQLSKCAQAQAFRIGFPEIGAMPTAEEMEGKEIDIGTIDKEVERVHILPPYPQDRFEANMPKWMKLIGEGKNTADHIISMLSTKAVLGEWQIEQIKNIGVLTTEINDETGEF